LLSAIRLGCLAWRSVPTYLKYWVDASTVPRLTAGEYAHPPNEQRSRSCLECDRNRRDTPRIHRGTHENPPYVSSPFPVGNPSRPGAWPPLARLFLRTGAAVNLDRA